MKLVLVDWLDSHQSRGWQDVERIEEAAEPLYCRSVGWLVAENPDCKVLVPHVSGERNGTVLLQGCGDMTIPNKAIIKMRVLRKN